MRKYIIFLSEIILTSSCGCQMNNPIAPGYEFSNFYNTSSEKLAKTVENNDTISIENVMRTQKMDINYLDLKFHLSLLIDFIFLEQ